MSVHIYIRLHKIAGVIFLEICGPTSPIQLIWDYTIGLVASNVDIVLD